MNSMTSATEIIALVTKLRFSLRIVWVFMRYSVVRRKLPPRSPSMRMQEEIEASLSRR